MDVLTTDDIKAIPEGGVVVLFVVDSTVVSDAADEQILWGGGTYENEATINEIIKPWSVVLMCNYSPQNKSCSYQGPFSISSCLPEFHEYPLYWISLIEVSILSSIMRHVNPHKLSFSCHFFYFFPQSKSWAHRARWLVKPEQQWRSGGDFFGPL